MKRRHRDFSTSYLAMVSTTQFLVSEKSIDTPHFQWIFRHVSSTIVALAKPISRQTTITDIVRRYFNRNKSRVLVSRNSSVLLPCLYLEMLHLIFDKLDGATIFLLRRESIMCSHDNWIAFYIAIVRYCWSRVARRTLMEIKFKREWKHRFATDIIFNNLLIVFVVDEYLSFFPFLATEANYHFLGLVIPTTSEWYGCIDKKGERL
jgi:hypothetical protein